MADVPTGFPTMGGEFAAAGPDKGNYHVRVADGAWQEASTGTMMLVLKLEGKDDPNHPAREGKNVATMFQAWPKAGADRETVLKSKGMIKRMVYDGFGLPWPKDEQELNPAKLLGKTAWVQIGETKDKSGNPRTGVVAVSQTLEKLPVQRVKPQVGAAAKSSAGAASGGGSRRRGARATV